MNKETNIITNEILEVDTTSNTIYDICKDIHTMLSVLTFTIIIIFLFKILKSNFSLRK